MRSFSLNQIGFRGHSFVMATISDPWGIDDVVVGAIVRGIFAEDEALTWWLAMCETAPAEAVMFDIGSYTGIFSLLACARNPGARVVAIEASTATFARLVQNITFNRFDVRINPNHVAVSASNGIAHLGHAFGVLSMASGESLEPGYPVDHSELVPTVRLDDLVFQNVGESFGAIASKAAAYLPLRAVGGVKIDVEGVEVAVLTGARRFFDTYKPPLLIEILSTEHLAECVALLGSVGYAQLAECQGQNYVFAHTSSAEHLVAAHRRLSATSAGPGSPNGFTIRQILTYEV
jgi:FkbM family methyltransferase